MSYLIVLVIVSALIFAHELGHYVAARALGIPIRRFSIGLGGKLVSFRFRKTEFRVSVFPFGGYVLPEPESFFSQTASKRMIFALGGPAANLLCTAALLALFNVMLHGPSVEAIFVEPIRQTITAVGLVVGGLTHILYGSHEPLGLLGVVSQGGELVGTDFLLAIQFAVVMSINLAIINLVPIPPLDGGRVVLCLAEMAHDRAARLHIPLNIAGFVAILGLIGYTTLLDLRRVFVRLIG